MSTTKKERLDKIVVEEQIAQSRDEAQRLIRRGAILVNENPIDKPGTLVEPSSAVRCRYTSPRFVSRGGEKLERALQTFDLSVKGCCCVDLGASTGGFIDCLLQHGARKVYGVDVGYGQLHERLRTDPHVVIMDKTNARYVTPDRFSERVDVVTADLSFISLRLVLPAARRILSSGGFAIVLVKPQFEIGKGRVGKGGVVRKKEDHIEVLEDFGKWVSENWTLKGLTPSPIQGKDGNIEFLAWLKPGAGESCLDVGQIVEEAHESALGG